MEVVLVQGPVTQGRVEVTLLAHDVTEQREETLSLQKSLQEEVALRKEDPRPDPHPAHHVEEVLHLIPGPGTQGREVKSRCFRRFLIANCG